MDVAADSSLRDHAMAFVRRVQDQSGGTVRHEDVSEFVYQGQRIPLLDRQRGIRKPLGMEAALTIRTVYASRPDQAPYNDRIGGDGMLRYQWRRTPEDHSENRALRMAMARAVPLIWFWGVGVGTYLPVMPVWILAEDRQAHEFVIAVGVEQRDAWAWGADDPTRREYILRLTKERVHQPVFRQRVLDAYHRRCALCHIGYRPLLDAAHIRADSEGGEPVVPNGIAMCRIHHAAFDSNLLGVRPDFEIEVRRDVLDDSDGPMLVHGIQGVHGQRIELPTQRLAYPDRDLLAERFDRFREAC